MNILKITQVNKWFVVEHGDNKITMLNQRALVYHLKKFGFDSAARASIVHMFEYETTICIDLDQAKIAA